MFLFFAAVASFGINNHRSPNLQERREKQGEKVRARAANPPN